MATHVKWADPEREEDFNVHLLYDTEWTLCGLAYEGSAIGLSAHHKYAGSPQNFIRTKERVTCGQCQAKVAFCKKVKTSELEG